MASSLLGALVLFESEAYAQAGAAGAGGAAGAAGASGAGQAGGVPAPENQPPPEGETKVVIFVEGPVAAEVRAEIEKSLPAGVVVLPEPPFIEALKKQALLPLAKTIKGQKERLKAIPKLQLAAQEVGANAAIVAVATPLKGGKYDVPILIMPSDSLAPLASVNAVGPSKDGAQLRAEAVAGVVSASISGIIPPPQPDPETKTEDIKIEEKDPEPPKVEEKKPEPPPINGFVRGRFLFEAGLGTQGRSFFYILPQGVDRSDVIRGYEIPVAPHFFVHGDFYPFAAQPDSFLSHFGLTAVAGLGAPLKSTLEGGGRDEPEKGVKTTFFHFRVGPKARFTFGSDEKPWVFTGEVAYSHWNFTIDDSAGSSPSYVYPSARPGVGLRVPAGPLALLFEGGLHYVFPSGEFARRFPNASVLGFDAQLGLAIPISPTFEGRVNLNYNRYRGNLKADLDADYVAGGSVDQFFGLHLGAAIAP